MPEPNEFSIPEPRIPDSSSALDQISRVEAEREIKDFSRSFSPAFHDHYDWVLRFVLRPMLFIFIIGVNAWWDWNVKNLVWQAGRAGSGFHLDNAVLIALITTSMANFLAIVAIVARHLFPNSK
jgi:hypothetical protein